MPTEAYRSREEDPGEDLLRLYLNDCGRYPLLTKEDEAKLGRQVQAGLEAATELISIEQALAAQQQMVVEPSIGFTNRMRRLKRDQYEGEVAHNQFVNSNVRLVVSIAKKFQSSGVPLLDLIQAGNLGLIHAVDKFDARKGFKFSTYATWWIRKDIHKEISGESWLSVDMAEKVQAYIGEKEKFEVEYGCEPTLAEIADLMRVSLPIALSVVEAYRKTIQPILSLDALVGDGDIELGALLAAETPNPADAAARLVMRREIGDLIYRLLDKESATALAIRFRLVGTLSEDHARRERPYVSFEDVGAELGLSKDAAITLVSNALKRLKDRGGRNLRVMFEESE